MTYVYKRRERAKYLAHPIFEGKSLRELEKMTGIHKVQLARVFSRQVTPRPDTWTLIAKQMGCSVASLKKAVECQT